MKRPSDGFLDLAVRYLARSDKSKAHVTSYLVRRGASHPIAAATVRRLERLGYLNEAAHAARWTKRRLARKPMGRLRLKEELLEREFSVKLVEDTIARIYETIDETELAAQALALRGGRQTVPQMNRFLEGRGFSRETIIRVLGIEAEE